MSLRQFFLFFSMCVLALSCRPEPDEIKLLDEFVVATNYDASADFSSYSTFAIPTDTIGFVSNASEDTIIVASESEFPRPVLQAVLQNMQARGYSRVERNANPDLGINVLVVNDFDVFQQVVYPGYNYPGNFYGGYYGYGSWYYYPFIETYAYNTGVLIIEIVDLKNKTVDNQVKVIWDAYMGDVYSTVNRNRQAEEGINQAFAQSTYLIKSR